MTTDRRKPAAGSPAAHEAELRRLEGELRDKALVMVGWHRRRGGGVIRGDTVAIALPGEPELRPTTDAELAGIRALERRGVLAIGWPFRCFRADEDHAPIDDAIEAAAAALLA